MKKLLLMVPMLHQGGFERVCVTTARLMQKYYDVTILIFSDKDINYDVTGINVVNIDVPATKKFGKFGKAVNVLRRVKKVREYKKNKGIDIAYSFGSSANYVNTLSHGGNNAKVLTGLRCSTDMEAKKQVALFCNKADQVLSCSKEIMRELKRDYNYERSSYIYNPLEVDKVRDQAKDKTLTTAARDTFTGAEVFPEKKESFAGTDDQKCTDKNQASKGYTLISVGRQDYIKGFWHLIKAFKYVVQKHPGSRLIILGTGDFSNFRKLAVDLGIGESVFFPGLQKNPFPFVDNADLYVLSSNHEGFPNALLEAMALGKPCVAADCKTGPREILLSDEEYNDLITKKPDGSSTDEIIRGTYGIIVPDMDEHEDFDAANITEGDKKLAEGILMMLEDEDKMKEYGQKAYERSRTYDPEKYAEDLNKILEQV